MHRTGRRIVAPTWGLVYARSMRLNRFPALTALLASGLALFTVACSPASDHQEAPKAGQKGPVVLAAASLQDSVEAAADLWTKQGHAKPVLTFAASSALARQVENGAPADLFFSADEEWMDELAAKKLLRADSRVTVLGNTLVLIAPKASAVKVSLDDPASLGKALGSGRLAMADPAAVPAGKYGKAALEKLGIWASVKDRVASGENVRTALTFVERGEAPLGIVYATDAGASGEVRVVATFPASSHPPIRYPLAILAASKNRDAAAFRAYLLSTEGQGIFAGYGFTKPE